MGIECEDSVWTLFQAQIYGVIAGSFEHGNEPSFSIKGRELID